MSVSSSSVRLIAALSGTMLLASGLVHAQWQWVDDTGRKVFSDTPPPATVPDRNILRRPHARAQAASVPAPADASTEEGSRPTPAVTGRDEQLEARRRQAEEAEKAREQAEQARVAQIRQENCERATRARATLMSGVRVSTTNARGEVEIMDDRARAAEVQRLDRILAQDCGPLPQSQ